MTDTGAMEAAAEIAERVRLAYPVPFFGVRAYPHTPGLVLVRRGPRSAWLLLSEGEAIRMKRRLCQAARRRQRKEVRK